MPANNFNIKGLSGEQVILARKKFGENTLHYKQENSFLYAIKNLAKEPMIILLLVAFVIYFVSGKRAMDFFLPLLYLSFLPSPYSRIQEAEMLYKN